MESWSHRHARNRDANEQSATEPVKFDEFGQPFVEFNDSSVVIFFISSVLQAAGIVLAIWLVVFQHNWVLAGVAIACVGALLFVHYLVARKEARQNPASTWSCFLRGYAVYGFVAEMLFSFGS